MNITIQGNSGCKLVVKQAKDAAIVTKYAADTAYCSRLKKQAQKQQFFYRMMAQEQIKIPRIHSSRTMASLYSFSMDFLPSLDFVAFFQIATIPEINFATENICRFIDTLITKSPLTNVDSKEVQAKYLQVKEKSYQNNLLSTSFLKKLFTKTDLFFSQLPTQLLLPIGICHGDLTYSNILFNRKQKSLVLIDFLDCFLESPIMDMVKLRQDTLYYWSFNFFNASFDKTKLEIVLKHIDQIFDHHFRQYHFYRQYYLLFQVLNFLRLLPYTKNPTITNYLQTTFTDLIKKIN